MEKKPNGCMINQKIKTYLTRQPKMQASTKIITNYSKKLQFIFQAYAKKIPFFPIMEELHHLHKAMGGGSTSP
jgi:hypothetical protein